ncbi:MAG: helix-turn-helix domain-containing protein [Inhella sp.]
MEAPARVDQVLSRSRAQLERRLELGDGMALALWRNAHDSPRYVQPGHHTLSVYLQGGQGTRALGMPGEGSPGCHCVLSAEHESRWQVGSGQRFLHLYCSGLSWAERVVRLLDAEPRALSLGLRLFAQDAALTHWGQAVAALDWAAPEARLQAEALAHQALDRLLLDAATPAQRQGAQRPRGGLSAAARRQLLGFLEAHLDAPSEALSLAALAARVHLSEFHFARMFRVSMGCSVHEWLAAARRRRALQLVRQGRLPLAEVAQRCGYANPSHLSRTLRGSLGLSPRELRRLGPP